TVRFHAEVQAFAVQFAIFLRFRFETGEHGICQGAASYLAALHVCIPAVQFFPKDTSRDTRSAMLCGFTGERVDTRKPARGGLSGGVFSHVGTCENLHLVEPGGFEPPSASSPLSVLHA